MKRRHLRIYRKRRKKKTLILILICILLIGIAAAERIGYIDMEQFISNKQEAIPYQKVSKTAEENTEKYYYRQLPEFIGKSWKVSEITQRRYMYMIQMRMRRIRYSGS